jgi:hypothetical protein
MHLPAKLASSSPMKRITFRGWTWIIATAACAGIWYLILK